MKKIEILQFLINIKKVKLIILQFEKVRGWWIRKNNERQNKTKINFLKW